MDDKYILGVAVAILCGFINNAGLLLQKKVVNDIPVESRGRGFMLKLLKNPLWLTGLSLQLVLGAATFMIAQALIGPALVPGLMNSGMILLAIGSVMLIGEKLNPSEYLGIGLMIVGILLLGLSGLDIGVETVRAALDLSSIRLQITIFTACLLAIWGVAHLVSLRSAQRKGVLMGFSNGFLYALSNFWVSPLIAVITLVLTGQGTGAQVIIFVVACVLLVGANVTAIRQIQEAFKFGQVSNIVPIQQISIQLAPILVYFYVFSLKPPRAASTVYIIVGVALIIVSGFLLGRRQEEIEMIK